MLSVLALGLPAAVGAEEAFTQTASVSYRSADGTQQEVYSGYGMAVQGSTLTLDLKGNAAGGAGWNVEDLDPAMLRLDSQTVTRLSDTKPQLAVTKLQFTALKPGTTVFQIRQKGNDPTNDLEIHLTIDQAQQISSVHFTRPGASGETDGKTAASLRKSLASVKDPFQETHEGHLIRNGFTGEAYSDDMVLLHLDWGMTQKDVEKLAKKNGLQRPVLHAHAEHGSVETGHAGEKFPRNAAAPEQIGRDYRGHHGRRGPGAAAELKEN